MNISFSMTKKQFRERTKTVTRRRGWWNVKPGAILQGVEKGMGLKKGEKVVYLGPIRVVNARREPLRRMIDDTEYGFKEVAREGFGGDPRLGWPSVFVEFFAASHKCTIDDDVMRIEYEYI